MKDEPASRIRKMLVIERIINGVVTIIFFGAVLFLISTIQSCMLKKEEMNLRYNCEEVKK